MGPHSSRSLPRHVHSVPGSYASWVGGVYQSADKLIYRTSMIQARAHWEQYLCTSRREPNLMGKSLLASVYSDVAQPS